MRTHPIYSLKKQYKKTMAGLSVYFKNIEMIDQEADKLGMPRSNFINKCVDDYFERKVQASQHRYINDKKTLALGLLLGAVLALQMIIMIRLF